MGDVHIPAPEATFIHENLSNLIEWVRLAVETTGALFVLIGAASAIRLLLITGRPTANFNVARLTLARYLVIALEFQLASDILSTAVAPSWDKIGKLAAIAIIRTALNFFLMKELEFEQDRQEQPKEAASS